MTSNSPQRPEKDVAFQREALSCLPDVTRFALSLARNEADAADLVQETYLRAYRSWHSYELGTECRGWLFTICRNLFFRTRQREQRHSTYEDPELEALAAAALHASAQQSGYGDMFERIDLSEAVDQALMELPETYREAVVLVDLQDQSYETAASVLGVPTGTVRSRLFRGRRLLQEKLVAYAQDAGIIRSGPDSSDAERQP
jgi:RNA polymerase sigma-70 factor (ECF subfamily)